MRSALALWLVGCAPPALGDRADTDASADDSPVDSDTEPAPDSDTEPPVVGLVRLPQLVGATFDTVSPGWLDGCDVPLRAEGSPTGVFQGNLPVVAANLDGDAAVEVLAVNVACAGPDGVRRGRHPVFELAPDGSTLERDEAHPFLADLFDPEDPQRARDDEPLDLVLVVQLDAEPHVDLFLMRGAGSTVARWDPEAGRYGSVLLTQPEGGALPIGDGTGAWAYDARPPDGDLDVLLGSVVRAEDVGLVDRPGLVLLENRLGEDGTMRVMPIVTTDGWMEPPWFAIAASPDPVSDPAAFVGAMSKSRGGAASFTDGLWPRDPERTVDGLAAYGPHDRIVTPDRVAIWGALATPDRCAAEPWLSCLNAMGAALTPLLPGGEPCLVLAATTSYLPMLCGTELPLVDRSAELYVTLPPTWIMDEGRLGTAGLPWDPVPADVDADGCTDLLLSQGHDSSRWDGRGRFGWTHDWLVLRNRTCEGGVGRDAFAWLEVADAPVLGSFRGSHLQEVEGGLVVVLGSAYDGRLTDRGSLRTDGPRVMRWRPDAGRHWLALVLQGTSSNPSAIGSEVRVRWPDGHEVRRFVGDHASAGMPSATFPLLVGLGPHTEGFSVEVSWAPVGDLPSRVDRFEDLAADSVHHLVERRP